VTHYRIPLTTSLIPRKGSCAP